MKPPRYFGFIACERLHTAFALLEGEEEGEIFLFVVIFFISLFEI